MTALPRPTSSPRRRRAALLLVAAVTLFALAAADRAANADEPAFGPNDVPTAFFINKSDDHNRVDYGVRLDAACQPAGSDPVFPYWREFENSPPVRTHKLKWIEHFIYGVNKQRVLRRDANGSELVVRLKKLDREVTLTITRTAGGHCACVARTNIGPLGNALLHSAYVKLLRANSVEYLEIRGAHPETGAPLTERISP
mgnify:CR=1 FL=1